jgi:hypothetical protein
VRVAIVIGGLVAWTGVAGAQTPAEPSALPRGRAVDDHLFIPSELVRDPFTATHFQTSTGYGYATATGGAFNVLGTSIGSRDYKFGTMLQSFELQAKIFDWWAVRIESQGLIFSGINGTSALNVGVTARFNVGAGTTVSFPIGDRIRLGGTFDFGYTPDINVNVITGIVRSVAARDIDVRNLLVDTRLTAYQVDASVAVALHRSLGLTATGGYLRVSSDTDGVGDTINAVSAAAAFDFDLKSFSHVPLGFILAYKLNESATRDQGQQTEAVSGGIFYIGVPKLVAGVDFSERWFNLVVGPPGRGFLPFEARTEDTALTLVQIVMRYTW